MGSKQDKKKVVLPSAIKKMKTIEQVHEYYQKIIRCMPNNVYWLDENCITQGCNQNVLDFIGLKDINDFIGMTYEEMGKVAGWTEGHEEKYKKDDEIVIKTGKAKLNIEDPPIHKPDGTKQYYLSSRMPIFDEDKVVGIVGISVDISDIKSKEEQLKIAKEKAEAANRAKAEFIANMSHDIRTPLTGIIGLATIVENESHEEMIKEYAHMLNISGEQLLSLLNSVLEIVAADTIGHKALKLSTFSLEDLLRSIFELELPSLQLKSIDFKLDMDEALPAFIESDKEKIYRIVLNILSNAIKFTHDGSITIKTSLVEQNGDEMVTKIQVIDTGIGIPEEDISKVFDQFYRANPAHEGKFDGYGVGLHIVQKYLKLLKGEVLVESEVGKGTCISLTLPLKKANQPVDDAKRDSRVKKDISSEPATEKSETKMTQSKSIENPTANVLLVEDDKVARMVAKTMLTNAQCQVLEAENSREAYQLFINNQFDFVLTDIGLPDYSGLELAKKMHQFQIENHCDITPVIALSGHEDTERFLADELNHHVACMYTKPLRTEELTEILKSHGHHHEAPIAANPSPTLEKNSQDHYLMDEKLAIKQLGSVDMVRKMAQMMLDEAFAKIIPEIDKYFQSQDWTLFKKQIHKFKSACLYCATTPLLELVQELESLADNQDLDKIAPVYDEFLSCAEQTRQYILVWLKT